MNPKTDSRNTVDQCGYRISVLTGRCIRIEHSLEGKFNDSCTVSFINRQVENPEFTVTHDVLTLIINTEFLEVRVADINAIPSRENVKIKSRSGFFNWSYGDSPSRNLLGSYRTLDCVTSSCPLSLGLISRDGFSVFDDSKTPIIISDLVYEKNTSEFDTYFFGYGNDYLNCIKDYLKISGRPPLLPRYTFGLWWSRYSVYTSQDMINIVEAFKEHDVPLSVYVIDMDWHVTKTGNASRGWTGYSWNKDLVPDPAGLLEYMHKNNAAVTLNLHPADGVWPHEDQYDEMAKAMGITPPNHVPFNCEDPKFMENYFKVLHHPLETMGVDFWWIDWQQGTGNKIDPLIALNHSHFHDNARSQEKRPLVLSRWCGLGGQRYPIGFSGDTFVDWESLSFQPYFTSTASNVGFCYWSHDIGGHHGGFENAELYTRWIQYGLLSPFLRMHCNINPFHERLPWGYDKETEFNTLNALKFRNKMIPYLYSVYHKYSDELVPAIQPMYYKSPNEEEAYNCPTQYYFGDDLIAAPFVQPIDKDIGLSEECVWLPKGLWIDYQSGREYSSGWHTIFGGLSSIPMFMRCGSIFVTSNEACSVSIPSSISIEVFPFGQSTFDLYEDDGVSQKYVSGEYHISKIESNFCENCFGIHVSSIGNPSLIPSNRNYQIIFRNAVDTPRIITKNCTISSHKYNGSDYIVEVVSQGFPFEVSIEADQCVAIHKTINIEKEIFTLIKHMNLGTWDKSRSFSLLKESKFDPYIAANLGMISQKARFAIIKLICDCGFFRIPSTTGSNSFIMWNSSETQLFRYTLKKYSPKSEIKITTSSGVVPKSMVYNINEFKPKNHHSIDLVLEKHDLLIQFADIMTYQYDFSS